MIQVLEKSNTPLLFSDYRHPTRGLLSMLPRSWVPYAELMRIHKPVGILNIYYPYAFGLLYAAITRDQLPSLRDVSTINAGLFFSCFMLRSAGCTWNDMVDADVDKLVARCRVRPLARGAIPMRNAYVFLLVQTLVWIASLVLILGDVQQTLLYAIPLTGLVIFYPYAKRVTYYAQVFLGFTLAYGVYIGYASLVGDLSDLKSIDSKFYGALILYAAYIVWSVIHDLIYAFQDYKDDLAAGLKSMATDWQDQSKPLLVVLAIIQVSLFVAVGLLFDMHISYYIFACLGVGILETLMLTKIDLSNPAECWHWFQYGCIGFGLLVCSGLFSEYVAQALQG